MVKISKLGYLQGKPQKFKIGDQEIELKPLTIDDMGILSIDRDTPIEKQIESMKKFIYAVLKKSIPDYNEEEAKNISLEYMTDLTKAVMKLHKLEGDETMTKISSAIKAKQDALKKEKT